MRTRPVRVFSIFVFLTFFLSTVASLVHADVHADTPTALQPYIIVEADYFEIDLISEEALFRGDVAATQGNNTFRTAQLTLQLEQIIGRSNTRKSDRQGNQAPLQPYELSAAKLTYDLDNNTIIGRGGSELRRGSELIRAERLRYQVLTRKAYGDPAPGGRVTVQFIADPDQPVFAFGGLAAPVGG